MGDKEKNAAKELIDLNEEIEKIIKDRIKSLEICMSADAKSLMREEVNDKPSEKMKNMVINSYKRDESIIKELRKISDEIYMRTHQIKVKFDI